MGDGYAYISRQPCGCLGMAIVDSPERKQDVAKEVAKAIRLGETVERVTTEYVRTVEWWCPAHKLERELDESIRPRLFE